MSSGNESTETDIESDLTKLRALIDKSKQEFENNAFFSVMLENLEAVYDQLRDFNFEWSKTDRVVGSNVATYYGC